MKILIINSLYPPHVVGGAEKAAALLAESLVRYGHEVVVVSLHPGSNEVVENRNGVRVYRFPIDNLYWPFGQKRRPNALLRVIWHVREMWNSAAARRIGIVLDAEKPDVVNTHNICGFSVAAWREVNRRNLRLVHTVHDYYLMCSRCTLFNKAKNCESRCVRCRVFTVLRRNLAQLPDRIVSVSQHALQEHVRRGYFRGRATRVIYNIQGAFEPFAKPNEPSTNVTFGFMARIEEEKGIETLLAATRKLQKPSWRLKIAGRGVDSYVSRLVGRFPDARIEWLGFTDAAQFYSSVDVVIIPSLWAEPLPYVCVESLHAGKGLICASTGGIPEIAKLSHMVEFFPAGDSNALAKKMSLAIDSPQAWHTKVPDASKLSAFRVDHVVERYVREYEESLSGLQPYEVKARPDLNIGDSRPFDSKDQTSASVTQKIGSKKD
jgi:glycosyltransferase involved in cell wall biosynthesis